MLEVAHKYLGQIKLDVSIQEKTEKKRESLVLSTEERLRIAIAQTFSVIHTSVAQMSNVMLLELKRHNYVTPTNYIELVTGYQM